MDKGNVLTNDTPVVTHVLTPEQFKQALPKQIHGRVNTEVMNSINAVLTDSTVRENFRDNLLSYTNVLQSGRYKIHGYVDAVKYVSYKLLGYTNQDSYAKTFPGRVDVLRNDGASEKTISAYVAAYNGNKLVNAIWEQTLVPSYVLNADVHQEAINKQRWLMLNAKSEKVQSDSANSLLIHLKPPESTKIELDIGLKTSDTIQQLKEATIALASMQKQRIEDGTFNAQQVAHSKLTVNSNDGAVIEAEEI